MCAILVFELTPSMRIALVSRINVETVASINTNMDPNNITKTVYDNFETFVII